MGPTFLALPFLLPSQWVQAWSPRYLLPSKGCFIIALLVLNIFMIQNLEEEQRKAERRTRGAWPVLETSSFRAQSKAAQKWGGGGVVCVTYFKGRMPENRRDIRGVARRKREDLTCECGLRLGCEGHGCVSVTPAMYLVLLSVILLPSSSP